MKTTLSLFFSLGIVAFFLTSCAVNNSQIEQQADFYGLPAPSQVFVGQFAFTAHDPNPDQSIRNRMNSQFTAVVPQTPEEQAGQAVAQKMQKSLIKNLNKEGIVATGTLDNLVPPVGSMVIEGELLTVKDAGSFQRLSTGLASGQAKVVSYVSVYRITPKGIVNFAQFYSNTQTTVRPDGATQVIIGSGAGNAAIPVGGNVTTLGAQGQSAQADAVLIAKQIARKMGKIFAAEDWINPNVTL